MEDETRILKQLDERCLGCMRLRLRLCVSLNAGGVPVPAPVPAPAPVPVPVPVPVPTPVPEAVHPLPDDVCCVSPSPVLRQRFR